MRPRPQSKSAQRKPRCSDGNVGHDAAQSKLAGLRCPSEHLGLRWADLDWGRGRMTVHSPKTEHHRGKATREMPIFQELEPYFEAVRQEAPQMQIGSLPTIGPAMPIYGPSYAGLSPRLALNPGPSCSRTYEARGRRN